MEKSFDPQRMKSHWQDRMPVHDSLKSASEFVADAFVEMYLPKLDLYKKYDIRPYEDIASEARELYYGRITKIPPVVFGEVTKDGIEMHEETTIPRDNDEIEALADRYDVWAKEELLTEPYRQVTWLAKDALINAMKEMKGQTYPRQKWTAAAEAEQSRLSKKTRAMGTHYFSRITNAAFDYDQLNMPTAVIHRPYKKYILATSNVMSHDLQVEAVRDIVQIPVGEYGSDAATKLASITIDMNDFIKNSSALQDKVTEYVDDETTSLLVDHTARARERKATNIPDFAVGGLKSTLSEGVLSVSQVLALMTAGRSKHFATHEEYVRAILDTDLVEQFTRIIPPGYIGPTTLSGFYMPNVLEMEGGKLRLNREVVKVLSELRRKYAQGMMEEWHAHEVDGKPQPEMLGTVCPASKPDGAISTLRKVFKHYYS